MCGAVGRFLNCGMPETLYDTRRLPHAASTDGKPYHEDCCALAAPTVTTATTGAAASAAASERPANAGHYDAEALRESFLGGDGRLQQRHPQSEHHTSCTRPEMYISNVDVFRGRKVQYPFIFGLMNTRTLSKKR